MLAIPTRGFAVSVNAHNVELDVLSDWIEASILFVDDELSTSDLVDTLCDEQIYRDQDFANDRVGNAWTELKRRAACMGNNVPYSLTKQRIIRMKSWDQVPGHSFCLMLALAKWYKNWAKQFGRNFTEQGEIFEELTKESLEAQLPSWKIISTGWTRTRATRLAPVVRNVAAQLGEPEGDIRRWTKATANEAGLDLVCFRPFTDCRGGLPVFLFQCASGRDWDGKLHTPNLRIWSRIVNFTAEPKKAFSTPFAFLDTDFTRNCNLVDGLLLDRYRLLAPGHTQEQWVSDPLAKRIVKWLKPRIKKLPVLGPKSAI